MSGVGRALLPLFIRETCACRCLRVSGAARRAGVAEGAPSPGLQARQTTTVAAECHGRLYMVLSASIWEGRPLGEKGRGGQERQQGPG